MCLVASFPDRIGGEPGNEAMYLVGVALVHDCKRMHEACLQTSYSEFQLRSNLRVAFASVRNRM